MYRKDCLNHLEFDDHPLVDEKINPVPVIDVQTLVTNRDQNLFAD
jgi:hypothetical protein